VAELGAHLPLWSALPFAGLLLSIALLPLLTPGFWHRHFPKVSAAWALALAVPFVAVHRDLALQEVLKTVLAEYLPFLILIGTLYTIAGGIRLKGRLVGTPRVNLLLLLAGTLAASWIGTTGAAMVFIRPLLRANARRRHRTHVVVFFIFLVANIGGSLTPLGDPPLFLGFLHGVPFFWTLRLLPVTALVAGLVLAMFLALDSWYYRREHHASLHAGEPERLGLEGWHNLLLLGGVVAAVIASGTWRPESSLGVYGHVTLEWPNLARDAVLLLLAWASLRTTGAAVRQANHFTWGPIREVSVLFAGIFVTMIPAVLMLEAGTHGAMGGLVAAVSQPWHYFWASGGLSSFLDNAPTYRTFSSLAVGAVNSLHPGAGLSADDLLPLAGHGTGALFLTAVSAGSVFMGANTYIGNAPNFMVKAIAEEEGVPMPSFFGYVLRFVVPALLPVFALATWLFFR
jgi:Na+/H+ antiporter NhaD/arsenite permease-like protein